MPARRPPAAVDWLDAFMQAVPPWAEPASVRATLGGLAGERANREAFFVPVACGEVPPDTRIDGWLDRDGIFYAVDVRREGPFSERWRWLDDALPPEVARLVPARVDVVDDYFAITRWMLNGGAAGGCFRNGDRKGKTGNLWLLLAPFGRCDPYPLIDVKPGPDGRPILVLEARSGYYFEAMSPLNGDTGFEPLAAWGGRVGESVPIRFHGWTPDRDHVPRWAVADSPRHGAFSPRFRFPAVK